MGKWTKNDIYGIITLIGLATLFTIALSYKDKYDKEHPKYMGP